MYKISIPPHSGICRIAAEEFIRLYRAMSGITLQFAAEDEFEGCDLILIGGESLHSRVADWILRGEIAAPCLRYASDDYAIRSERAPDGCRRLILHAAGERAPLYAVYDLFERLGCAYFWDGDRIPATGTEPELDGFDVTERPRFQYRGLRYFAHRSLHRFQAEHWDFDDWKREIDWIMKKRLNFFMLRTGLDDLFQRAFPEYVPYPEGDDPDFFDRTFDNRRSFEPLRQRGELRRNVLAYARERGLLHPEDTGTITHWYSRTPASFLQAVNPTLLNQPDGTNYNDPSSLVWDIRDDRNLDAYFKLTQTHVEQFGAPRLFHTIGLAERDYSVDSAANHRLKLYAYDRIISRLRRDYPDAPLWIGSWDFVNNWHDPALVRDLVARLDPRNTLLFDYTSDSPEHLTRPYTGKDLPPNDFTQWGVVGKFPWIFGIFHAFESGNEPRGNYRIIAERLPVAANDPFCRGFCFWPETSHTDTLMLEFFAANAWNPSCPEIERFLPEFCRKRYGENTRARFAAIWKTMLPVISVIHWRYDFFHANLEARLLQTPEFIHPTPEQLEKHRARLAEVSPVLHNVADAFRQLAQIDFNTLDPMESRDAIDLGRTAFHRLFLCRLTAFVLHRAAPETAAVTPEELSELLELEAQLLEAHSDYSLNDSLDQLKQRPHYNTSFENTLKGNAENEYCRTQIYELVRSCYQPELAAFLELTAADNPSQKAFHTRQQSIRDAFYATPLEKFRPRHEEAQLALPRLFERLAELSSRATAVQ